MQPRRFFVEPVLVCFEKSVKPPSLAVIFVEYGRVEEAYQEVARRLGILPEDPGRDTAETPTEEDA